MAAHRHSRSHARLQDLTLGALDIYQLARWRLCELARDIYVSLSRWLVCSTHTYRDRVARVRYSLVLGSLPLGIVTILNTCGHQEPALVALQVATEGVTARKQDYNTFHSRWYNSLPPSQVIHEVRVEVPQLQSQVSDRYRSSIVRSPRYRSGSEEARSGTVVPVTRTTRDICQRHGTHKKYYGNTWRCRR